MKHLLLIIALHYLLQVNGQDSGSLPRSTPSTEQVSASGINKFLDEVAVRKLELHSFMFLRHGKVIAEGWWNPYQPQLSHTMYSITKSITSTVVGIAISEKRFRLNDKVISFFPEELPAIIDSNLARLTVKDLLIMATGQAPDPTREIVQQHNWTKASLAVPVLHKPGSVFLYNNVGPNLLLDIVQKVTGQKITDYLLPRLFTPLGIKDVQWETDPAGRNIGGWGIRLKTEDMAKIGQLYLQQGRWKGKQLLSPAWVTEATSYQIEQSPEIEIEKRAANDWLQGYGYLFWRSRNNSYRADGAFGQYVIVLPEQDAVIAITSETNSMQAILDLVWENLLPALSTQAKPDPKADIQLGSRLRTLSISPLARKPHINKSIETQKKLYWAKTQNKIFNSVGFRFIKNRCELTLTNDTATFDFAFGNGRWLTGETKKRGPHLIFEARANQCSLPVFKIAGAYTWVDEHTIVFTLRYIQSPHSEIYYCNFSNDKVQISCSSSFEPGKRVVVEAINNKRL